MTGPATWKHRKTKKQWVCQSKRKLLYPPSRTSHKIYNAGLSVYRGSPQNLFSIGNGIFFRPFTLETLPEYLKMYANIGLADFVITAQELMPPPIWVVRWYDATAGAGYQSWDQCRYPNESLGAGAVTFKNQWNVSGTIWTGLLINYLYVP